MKAFFNDVAPTATSAAGKLVSAATIAGSNNYVIYQHSATNALGIYSASAGNSIVRHRVDLISGGSTIQALTDANFPTTGNSFAPTGANVGFANYGSYQGMSQRTDSGTNNSHSWSTWTLGIGTASNSNTPWSASNAQQIGFPMATSAQVNGSHIVGFCLSAGGSSLTGQLGTAAGADGFSGAPQSAILLLPGTVTAQVIFAYGDLSAARPVGQNDTPVFTQNAIVITLE